MITRQQGWFFSCRGRGHAGLARGSSCPALGMAWCWHTSGTRPKDGTGGGVATLVRRGRSWAEYLVIGSSPAFISSFQPAERFLQEVFWPVHDPASSRSGQLTISGTFSRCVRLVRGFRSRLV